MHPQDKDKVETQFLSALKNTVIESGYPQFNSFAPHLSKATQAILKTKNKWLSVQAINSIFFEFSYNALKLIKDDNELSNKNFKEIFDENELAIIAKKITNYIVSIPRTYELFFHFPQFMYEFDSPIQLSKSASLVCTDKEIFLTSTLKGNPLLGFAQTHKKNVYLKVIKEGYFENSINSKLIKESLSILKTTIQQGYSLEILDTKENLLTKGLISSLNQFSTPKAFIKVKDIGNDEFTDFNFELPYNYSKFINALTYRLLGSTPDNEERIKSILSRGAILSDSIDKESIRLSAAAEWHFDSIIEEDETMKFIKICIGLESILGDDKPEGALTHTLADRCAYIIGKSLKGRDSIRLKFKELYAVRSKLIHGVNNKLKPEENELIHFGNYALQSIILREMMLLNTN